MSLPDVVTRPDGCCWAPLPQGIDPLHTFLQLQSLPGCVFFDSALQAPGLGRFSYVAANPFEWITCERGEDGFALLSDKLRKFPEQTIVGLPPFQGGAAGYWGYELCHVLESIPRPRHPGLGMPDMAVGLYDVVAGFDLVERRGWLISQGLPESTPRARQARARTRLEYFEERICRSADPRSKQHSERSTARSELPPTYDLADHPGVLSDFQPNDYLGAVQRVVDYIRSGDVFQVNLTQRLFAPLTERPVEYYLRLRNRSAAPFAAYFDANEVTICSASPERFLRVHDGLVQTRPIKGTRPRSADEEIDGALARQLSSSEKDRAENTMIVDLLRNDLSRVCVDDSINVPVLCGLESYEQVHHLVSVVEGRLRPECSPIDLLKACFPGGSITGAPKVRAMEIISELESSPRGPYCGALGYIGFDGSMDSSILIRTAVAAGGWLQMAVGGGVVADSTPRDEYLETLQKAAGMLAALPRDVL